jgi:hypothetical protein
MYFKSMGLARLTTSCPLFWSFYMTNRREFVINCCLGTCTAATALVSTSTAAQAAMVAEADANAVSLGYKALATKVDKVKFPKYAAGQVCSNCALYQGKATDKAAGCPLFGAKQVAGPGWCSAWTKKA